MKKTCTKCGKKSPVSNFSKDRSRPDGRYNWDKQCAYKNARKWVKANQKHVNDKHRIYMKEWIKNLSEEKLEEYRKKARLYVNNRYRTDPEYRAKRKAYDRKRKGESRA